MNPLVIAGRVGERADLRLYHLMPSAAAQPLPDVAAQPIALREFRHRPASAFR
jgi:hypothetical protein